MHGHGQDFIRASCNKIPGVLPAKWATKGKEMSQVIFLFRLIIILILTLRHGWEHGCEWDRRFRRTDEKVASVMKLPEEESGYILDVC